MIDNITVCICTYHRNQMLENLIRHLAVQQTKDLFVFTVVIVDNDPFGQARELVSKLALETGIQIDYDVEPENTIPAARNRAIEMASGSYIAIIDDDEFPPPAWLVTLYSVLQATDTDGALGPIYPHFLEKPPVWLIKGHFCERPVYETGTLLNWDQTRTGNVLLKKRVFDDHMLRFDLKWKTSGSDRAFFKEAMRHGYKFIAVAEAPVYEIVPRERWKVAYHIRRALVHGYNSQRNTFGDVRGYRRLSVPMKSLAALIVYVIALPFAALRGKHQFVSYLERASHHFSGLCALLGIELVKKRGF